METCQNCGITITQKPRGRHREYCAACLKIRTAASKRESKRRKHQQKRQQAISLIPVQCCRDWAAAKPRNGFVCEQHRQWEAFVQYRHKVDWRRSGLAEFTWLLDQFCDGNVFERNFSIITAPLLSPFSLHYIVRVIVRASV